jgi:hypothetical protein
MQSRLLTIGEVAARLGRSVDFVRKETDEGRLRAEPRGEKGHRQYRDAAVTVYEARYGRGGRGTSAPTRKPTIPARRVSAPPQAARAVRPVPEDFWEDDLEPMVTGPRTPTATERVYLNNLVVSGMREAPWDLPADWRAKMHADLEQYITVDRFPYPESQYSALQGIRLHIEEFLSGYRDAKNKEVERERVREEAASAAERNRRALISYGNQLLELELRTWEYADPTSEARTEVQTVLNAEVKADWEEGDVRDLVNEVLARYEPEEDDGEDGTEDDATE